jgi:hypothetical protein
LNGRTQRRRSSPSADTPGIDDLQSSASTVSTTSELETVDPIGPTHATDAAIDPIGLLQGNNDADNVEFVTP